MARRQLLALGFTPKAVAHRIEHGRLHRIRTGVYAVGRPVLTLHGRWMAAVLAAGPGAVLSHESAAALWGIRAVSGNGPIDVSVIAPTVRQGAGLSVHRRAVLDSMDVTERHRIPVTTPACTLTDLAILLSDDQLEAAINEADKLGLITPDRLRSAIADMSRRPGIRRLRRMLDRRTFTLTDSALERRFLKLVEAADLPPPRSGWVVNGYKVDFHWPEFGLVVETDGLRYHRTPAQQARDRLRDQAHTKAGMTALRFTHAQVRFDPEYVVATLAEIANRLR